MRRINFIMACLWIMTHTIHGQQNVINVPLSNPTKSGVLEVNLITGSITVESYSGSEVIIEVINRSAKYDDLKPTKKGMKRIGGGGYGLEANEKNNHVSVAASNPNADLDLRIKVPKNLSLHLATINDGDIKVTNVNGNHELSNVNGDIVVTSISGSVVANTINGDIIITFVSVSPQTPMAFTNLNGEIEISLPSNTKLDIEAKSDNGSVFSDFDIKVENKGSKTKNSKINGYYKIQQDDIIYGSINGGGPTLTLSSMNGDIIIKKNQ